MGRREPVQDFQLLLSEPKAGMLELRLAGEVDLATVGPLRDATRRAASSGDYTRLVFDLTRVTFMDSSGLHVLADAQRLMGGAGCDTRVICDSSSLRKVFELTGLDRMLTIVDTRVHAYQVAA